MVVLLLETHQLYVAILWRIPQGALSHRGLSLLNIEEHANMRSIFAMMKSFSCSPLIFVVCSEIFALPQPKLIFG